MQLILKLYITLKKKTSNEAAPSFSLSPSLFPCSLPSFSLRPHFFVLRCAVPPAWNCLSFPLCQSSYYLAFLIPVKCLFPQEAFPDLSKAELAALLCICTTSCASPTTVLLTLCLSQPTISLSVFPTRLWTLWGQELSTTCLLFYHQYLESSLTQSWHPIHIQ